MLSAFDVDVTQSERYKDLAIDPTGVAWSILGKSPW
jgi:hypothetical protein